MNLPIPVFFLVLGEGGDLFFILGELLLSKKAVWFSSLPTYEFRSEPNFT